MREKLPEKWMRHFIASESDVVALEETGAEEVA